MPWARVDTRHPRGGSGQDRHHGKPGAATERPGWNRPTRAWAWLSASDRTRSHGGSGRFVPDLSGRGGVGQVVGPVVIDSNIAHGSDPEAVDPGDVIDAGIQHEAVLGKALEARPADRVGSRTQPPRRDGVDIGLDDYRHGQVLGELPVTRHAPGVRQSVDPELDVIELTAQGVRDPCRCVLADLRLVGVVDDDLVDRDPFEGIAQDRVAEVLSVVMVGPSLSSGRGVPGHRGEDSRGAHASGTMAP